MEGDGAEFIFWFFGHGIIDVVGGVIDEEFSGVEGSEYHAGADDIGDLGVEYGFSSFSDLFGFRVFDGFAAHKDFLSGFDLKSFCVHGVDL